MYFKPDETPFVRHCSYCDLNRQITLLQPSEQCCSVCGDVQFRLWYVGQRRHHWVLKYNAGEFYLSLFAKE